MEDAAKYLGVSIEAVKRWVEKANISKIYVMTDRKRGYIHKSDVVRLEERYRGKRRTARF